MGPGPAPSCLPHVRSSILTDVTGTSPGTRPRNGGAVGPRVYILLPCLNLLLTGPGACALKAGDSNLVSGVAIRLLIEPARGQGSSCAITARMFSIGQGLSITGMAHTWPLGRGTGDPSSRSPWIIVLRARTPRTTRRKRRTRADSEL